MFSPVKPSKLWANSYNLSFKKGGKNFLLGGERQGNLGGGLNLSTKYGGGLQKGKNMGALILDINLWTLCKTNQY